MEGQPHQERRLQRLQEILDELNCGSQDLTLQAILSNGVATVRQTLSRVFSAMAAERAKKGRKLVLTPDYINYRKPETVDKTIGDGALMWFYLSCNSYDWPCWAILIIGK